MRFSARILLSFFLFFIVSFFIASKSFAQTVPPASPSATQYSAPSTDSDVPKNLHTYTQNVMIETMAALICQISGIDPINPNQPCLGVDAKTGKIGFVQNGGGAIGLMTNAITMLYAPIINPNEYYQNLADNFGLVKKANAQTADEKNCNSPSNGTGFCGLTPLLGMWTIMRNLVYLLFVLVFIAIGFAIMLRAKIDPRTVMTIQNQIPKLIIGILLVTFSFAIAGFLIDVMYTSIYLLGNSIITADPQISNSNIVTQLTQTTQPFDGLSTVISTGKHDVHLPGFGDIPWQVGGSVSGFIAPLFDNLPGRTITGVIGSVIGYGAGNTGIGKAIFGGIGGVVGTFIAPGVGTAGGIAAGAAIGDAIATIVGGVAGAALGNSLLGLVGGIIAFLVVTIALLSALFRLWFTLIKAYLFFIINVVFGPFWILVGLLPGTQLSFGNWMREIISDLAVFPAVIVMFLMARVFMDQFAIAAGKGVAAFAPPMIGSFANPRAFASLIGMGMVLLTPSLLDKIKDAIKAPKVDLSPVYQALGAGAGATVGTARTVGQSQLASEELIMKKGANGLPEWQKRGRGLATLGRMFR